MLVIFIKKKITNVTSNYIYFSADLAILEFLDL